MGPLIAETIPTVDVLRRELEPGDPVVLSVLGTDGHDEIAGAVHDWVAHHVGTSVRGCLFFRVSIGATFGLLLSDGRRVVLKVLDPRLDLRYVACTRRVQRHLAARGFPCPKPVAGPAPLGDCLAVLDEHLASGRPPQPHDPAERRIMAAGLFRLIVLATEVPDVAALARHHMNDRPGRLWPVPHNALFDFEATAAGAEWIDDWRHRALVALARTEGPLVVGHVDWSAANVQVERGALSAVYDWDSLKLEREAVLVARAAVHFTYSCSPSVPRMPRFEEAQAFVDEYEASRGRPFSKRERASIGAAAVHSLAYTARCEHALDAVGRSFRGGARELLVQYGDSFLAPLERSA